MPKCRAKIVGTGEEVKGYYCEIGDKHFILTDDSQVVDRGPKGIEVAGFVEVKPETLAMFTTIRDKNKVEIYGSFLINDPILINGRMTKGGDRVRGIIDGEECEWDIVWETDDMLGWSIDNTNMPCEVVGRIADKDD